MVPNFIDQKKIPHKSGVYLFKNYKDQIIYVGKAIDLNSRVSSYFKKPADSLKTELLVAEIAGIDSIIVESEIEALILEANLIKKNLPKFNIRLTDDKDYLYIKVSKEDYPRILTARKQDLRGALKYFGPFPSSRTVKETLRALRKIFPWCSSPPKHVIRMVDGERSVSKNVKLSALRSPTKFKPCFYYHLRLCPGPCVGDIDKKEYLKIITRFCKFMNGQKGELIEELNIEMNKYSENLEFEKAESLKKIIVGIEYLTQPTSIKSYLENPNFLEDQREESLRQLQADLKLPVLPNRIEAYDVSNIQGKEATGSMVVLTDGEIDKSEYRKFKIKITGKPNDYAMHQELMRRRLKNSWPLPQLFLIDGGRGQVRASNEELNKMGVKIPIFGLAKKMEWLYPPEGEVIKLSKRRLSLRLLQRIRDESHRFAINYHRKLRSKKFLS